MPETLSTSSLIPVVDLSSSSLAEQVAQVKTALSTVGFLSVTGTSINERAKAVFALSKRFFAQDMEEKMLGEADDLGRGYTKLGKQHLARGTRDNKESFSFGKHSVLSKQPMSSLLLDAEAELEAFNQECYDLASRLMQLFALALEAPVDHFSRGHTFGKNTGFSLIHYPPGEVSREEVDIRAGAHKDWGTLTLLFQEANGPPGLEVFLPSPSDPDSSAWHAAPVVADSVLINVGLGMELWSGGAYKATLHRVVFPAGQVGHRYSMAYFVQADDDVTYHPILPGGSIDTSIPALTSLELFTQKLTESLGA